MYQNQTIEIPAGFTRWDGEENKCPCPGKAADVMFRDGHISAACVQMPKADGWNWKHSGHRTGDIVAYRITELET
jgi:hypothetical protein